MEKKRNWQLILILSVVVLTLYHIIPTITFYSRPLKSSIDNKKANQISESIANRVNDLEKESIEWIRSYCKTLNVKPKSILLDEKNPSIIQVSFLKTEDSAKFSKHFNRSASLISFFPAKMTLGKNNDQHDSKTLFVQRKIPIHFDQNELDHYFHFGFKKDGDGKPTTEYQAIIQERVLQLGLELTKTSDNAKYLSYLAENQEAQSQDLIVHLAQDIVSYTSIFGENSATAHRYFESFTHSEENNRIELVNQWISLLEAAKDKIRLEKIALEESQKKMGENAAYSDPGIQEKFALCSSKEQLIDQAHAIVKRNSMHFSNGKAPTNEVSLKAKLLESYLAMDPSTQLQTISLENQHVFIKEIVIDWAHDKAYLTLYPDYIASAKGKILGQQNQAAQDTKLLYNEIAHLSRVCSEKLSPVDNHFELNFSDLQDSQSFISLKLDFIAQKRKEQILTHILTNWIANHPELSREHFPVYDFNTYLSLPKDQRQLGLVVYAPCLDSSSMKREFNTSSIYVIAKGLNKILQKMQGSNSTREQFIADFNALKTLLQEEGMNAYAASSLSQNKEFANDIIFEEENFAKHLIKATREEFTIHGTNKYAVLEFTNLEQRILTQNKIENSFHDDLLKWADDYKTAQLGIRGSSPYDVPTPNKSLFFNNLLLSAKKYFRGDDRKIIRWGLDLSGGKTVQIQLFNNLSQPVTNPSDIKQGIDELYKRVNKMGVSEVNIRQEGDYITLDFPGSQGLSAHELVKASSMFFHVVNEKFSTLNKDLGVFVNQFLQEVWNEAVVTNRKSEEELNEIAYKHLHGSELSQIAASRSIAADKLLEHGLCLANPADLIPASSNLNERYSKIALLRGEDLSQWQGHTHPLMIVFRNHVLEGSNLENIAASYEPTKGNYLSFNIKGSFQKDGIKFTPRDDVYAWTSTFCKEKVQGTSLGNYTDGRGWRMAVILNGNIISSPSLEQTIRDSAMISGSFSQREVNQLESDLKAGSLTYTPKILSETNVSPELGAKERFLGITATFIALLLVLLIMVAYYRFAGLIASIAVFFNLLIMWAVLQNIHASLSLAVIAGIILTVGMAVDANVLVFERIREEFAKTNRLAHAVTVGYKKAFSAIFDSNLTTIIAAVILLQFDSGPIKGFAVSFIIGIASSMFTALFMTRFFFTNWVKNPKNKELKMNNWIRAKNFDFLKHAKVTIALSLAVFVAATFFLAKDRSKVLGMDFTGGFALNIELAQQEKETNYRQLVETALLSNGILAQDFQVRELSPATNIRLFMSKTMLERVNSIDADAIENLTLNPKINYIVDVLQKGGVSLTQKSYQNLEKNWSEISGQMSNTMRNNALIGLALALICILIYITVRFEFTYALSATLCTLYDVFFALAAICILHSCGVAVQIDLHTIAAIMTIIGYSLNDTIIVFDRIREDIQINRKLSLKEVINQALNTTLSRTTMTSLTTLAVLIPLIVLGGSTIFGFALVMAIGVIFGTLSSLFIAAPMVLFFFKKEHSQNNGVLIET